MRPTGFAFKVRPSGPTASLELARPPCHLPRSPQRPTSLGCAQLADLGLSRLLGKDGLYISDSAAVGTLTHIAPEQLQPGAAVTTSADVYAFGAPQHAGRLRAAPACGLHQSRSLLRRL